VLINSIGGHGILDCVPRRPNSAREILSQNAEIWCDYSWPSRLAAEREAALQALQKENEQLKSERTHYVERVVLLEEELRWMKAQYFGTSSQKTDAAAVNPDQAMLFRRARVAVPPSEILSVEYKFRYLNTMPRAATVPARIGQEPSHAAAH
jgi:hypothetical protein